MNGFKGGTNVASLIQEYRERHGMNFVLAVDEGLCFFDVSRKPAAIVLTSSPSRNITTCRECLLPRGGLIAELFVLTGQPYPSQTYKLAKHEHINPDTDLRWWVNDVLKGKEGTYEPFIATNDRDIECWLWRFFIRHHPLFQKKWANKDEPFRSLEQMAWTINNSGQHNSQPRLFEGFYKTLYYTFMLGRRYLLYS